MYIVFFLLARPSWKSAIAEGVSVNKYSFNNNNLIIINGVSTQSMYLHFVASCVFDNVFYKMFSNNTHISRLIYDIRML